MLPHTRELLQSAGDSLAAAQAVAKADAAAAEAAAVQAVRAVAQLLASVAKLSGPTESGSATSNGRPDSKSSPKLVSSPVAADTAAASSAAAGVAPNAAMSAEQAVLLWQAAADGILFPVRLCRLIYSQTMWWLCVNRAVAVAGQQCAVAPQGIFDATLQSGIDNLASIRVGKGCPSHMVAR